MTFCKQYILDKAKNPSDILDGLSGYYPVDNMRDNPYRDSDKVSNPTDRDVLSTSTQILMNLNVFFLKNHNLYKFEKVKTELCLPHFTQRFLQSKLRKSGQEPLAIFIS